ncbi:protein SRG1-like [Rutidosis leptorrhynchoides]|uniref:protein SRG1-like n=1 Tax=Rutidosis leptorrhynchoides TaxID=125765 RepID=UPI003A9A316C
MENQKEEKVNFRRSLIVPSVQQLANQQSITKIPDRYVQKLDHHDSSVVSSDNPLTIPSVPVIDLHNLTANTSTYSSELNKLHMASKEWGFFQVINHGISESLLEDFKREVFKLFSLSMEEKKKLWQDEDNPEGFGQLFVVSNDQKLDWSDMFYIATHPNNLKKSQVFQKLPLSLREKLEAYCAEAKKLAVTILDHMGKALGMETREMSELFEDGFQSMRMNYYPPCPEPELVVGISPHSDADALTILYQLTQTDGLQIRKDGKWVTVKPLPNALVVNVGDIMEIVSNGVYKSVLHRGMVNVDNERLSVATFYNNSAGTEVGPAKSLVVQHKVANFRAVPLEEYLKGYFAKKLDGKSYLDYMKLGESKGDTSQI